MATIGLFPPDPPTGGEADRFILTPGMEPAAYAVLVVEDNPAYAESLAHFLGLFEFEVRTVPDGPSAMTPRLGGSGRLLRGNTSEQGKAGRQGRVPGRG